MSSNPKVSVVLICYNHEKYIREAIDSILLQSFQDFELIIVDDGSTDDTFNIVHSYDDPRINAQTQKNSGPSIALNTGIKMSQGKYIAFMSGDDISFPNRLTTQINQIEIHQVDMIFCLPEIIGPKSGVLGWEVCSVFYGKEFENTAELYRILFNHGNFLCAPSCFCTRLALEKVGFFKRGLIQLQDFDYWIRACKNSLNIKLFNNPLIQYRYLEGENLSNKNNNNRLIIQIQ